MKRIVVFASGTGTNFINIFNNVKLGKVVLLISNNPGCDAVKFAKKNKLDFKIINNFRYSNVYDKNKEYENVLNFYQADLILLAGFLKKIPNSIINLYKNKIINVHPSLLPKYGGKGYFGMSVHEAVIKSNDKNTGVTIHFVNEKYDQGYIIMQQQVRVMKNDTTDTLSKRVLKEEYSLFLKAVNMFCRDKIKVLNKKVIIYD